MRLVVLGQNCAHDGIRGCLPPSRTARRCPAAVHRLVLTGVVKPVPAAARRGRRCSSNRLQVENLLDEAAFVGGLLRYDPAGHGRRRARVVFWQSWATARRCIGSSNWTPARTGCRGPSPSVTKGARWKHLATWTRRASSCRRQGRPWPVTAAMRPGTRSPAARPGRPPLAASRRCGPPPARGIGESWL